MTLRLSTQHTLTFGPLRTVRGALAPEELATPRLREPSALELDALDLEPLDAREALLDVSIGPFRIDGFLGEGSYARVWRATHEETGLAVAVKIATDALDESEQEEFEREVATLARMRHPNIVHVFDAGTVDEALHRASGGALATGTPYVVMELASRGSLENLRRPFTWTDFARIATQLLNGLAHAHARGVLHRDIKPANVLLGSTNDLRSHIKLADFGIAFSMDPSASDPNRPASGDVEQNILGTPLYMAPEQFTGRWRDYGPATDLYSFGVVAWELLTGRPPFGGQSAYELAMQHWNAPLPPFVADLVVPDGTLAWLKKLLAKDARDRFQFARHAADALVALGNPDLAEGDPARVLPPTLVEIATNPWLHDEPVLPALALNLLDVRPTPTLGRDAELVRVTGAVSRALAAGGRGVVTLRGASGVGVSHVARRVVEALHEAGMAQTIGAFCDDERTLDDVLRDAMRAVLRVDGLDATRARERLIEICGDVARELDVDVLLAWLDGAIDPEHSIFSDWFARLATRAPLVLWLDMTGTGADSGDLVSHILERCAQWNARCLILRSDSGLRGPGDREAPGRWQQLGTVHVEVLRPLDRDVIGRILASTMPFSQTLQRDLVEMSGGIPGRAIQAVRSWATHGRLGVEGGRIHLRSRT